MKTQSLYETPSPRAYSRAETKRLGLQWGNVQPALLNLYQPFSHRNEREPGDRNEYGFDWIGAY